MINATAHLLVLDADSSRGAQLSATLTRAGYGRISLLADPRGLPLDSGPGPVDLILADLDDPRAREAIAAVREAVSGAVPTPILGLTDDFTSAGRSRAASLGAGDFSLRPVQDDELRMRVDNALGAGRLRRLLNDRSARLTQALRDHSAEVDMSRESLGVLAAVADFHDDDTDQHAHRVGVLSGAIARELSLSDELVSMLVLAAPLHDIGKVGMSRRILLKPGSLTPAERVHMMQHVDTGAQILSSAQSPLLRLAAEIASTHHERWDGSGYTAGLSGEEIPLSGRIVAVADVWDTLTHDRPYRKAWTPDRALAEIHGQAGAHFDPTVVSAFSGLEHTLLGPLGAHAA